MREPSVILVHGKRPAASYDPVSGQCMEADWFPGVAAGLRAAGKTVYMDTYPQSWQPDYDAWKTVFDVCRIGPDTTLVGHSAGAGFLVRYLSENRYLKVGRVILVAPSLGLNWYDRRFFECVIDRNLVSRTEGVTIYHSTDDTPAIHAAVRLLRYTVLHSTYREYTGMGHFTRASMPVADFPDLTDDILGSSSGKSVFPKYMINREPAHADV